MKDTVETLENIFRERGVPIEADMDDEIIVRVHKIFINKNRTIGINS
jgi:hypothetical protein